MQITGVHKVRISKDATILVGMQYPKGHVSNLCIQVNIYSRNKTKINLQS